MEGSEEDGSSPSDQGNNNTYGFDILKRFHNASEIVAELSPPKQAAAPYVEGPYGLPMAPFMATPVPTKTNEITKHLGNQTPIPEPKQSKGGKRQAPKRAQSERLLQRTFTVESVSDLSNPGSGKSSKKPERGGASGKDKDKRKRPKSGRAPELIQDGGRAESSRPEATATSSEAKSQRKAAAKAKHKLLRKSASADCVNDLLALEEQMGRDETAPSTKKVKSKAQADTTRSKNSKDSDTQRQPSEVVATSQEEPKGRPETLRVSSDPQLSAEDRQQCEKEHSKRKSLRKCVSSACVTDLMRPEDEGEKIGEDAPTHIVVATAKAARSLEEGSSSTKEQAKKGSDLVDRRKLEARPEAPRGASDPQLAVGDKRKSRTARSRRSLLRKSASADCMGNIMVLEEDCQQVVEESESKPGVKNESASLEKQSKVSRRSSRAKELATATDPAFEEDDKEHSVRVVLRKSSSADSANDPLPEGQDVGHGSKKAKSKARRESSTRDKSAKDKERRKKSKPGQLLELRKDGKSEPSASNADKRTEDSKCSLLQKSTFAGCVIDPKGEENVNEKPENVSEKSAVKPKGACGDGAQKKTSVKRLQKVRRTKSSRDMVGDAERKTTRNSSAVVAEQKKPKRVSGETSTRRGVVRSSSSDSVNDLLSCFSSTKAKANLALLEKEENREDPPIRKEKRLSRRSSRPKLDKSLSVSCLRHAVGSSTEKSSSSRKAAQLKRKAKLNKTPEPDLSSRITTEDMEVGPLTEVQPQKLTRSNSTPDMFVEPAPIPIPSGNDSGYESIVSTCTGASLHKVKPSQAALKKTHSLPDLMQNDEAVDYRIADLSEPQKMSLAEACQLLASNDKSLTSLDLSDASIGDSGLKTLSKSMENNWFLRELHLGKSGITYLGAIPLARCLRRNKTLERLYLQSNALGDDGVEVLSAALAENQTLMVLNLARNNIGDIGTAALAEEISSSSRLQKLYLYENSIADIGATALGEIVKTCASLYELFIWDNSFGEKGANNLRIALKHRQEKHSAANLHIRSSWKHEGIVAQD